MIREEYERAKKDLKKGDFVSILEHDGDRWEGHIDEIDKGRIVIGVLVFPYKRIKSMAHVTNFDLTVSPKESHISSLIEKESET